MNEVPRPPSLPLIIPERVKALNIQLSLLVMQNAITEFIQVTCMYNIACDK